MENFSFLLIFLNLEPCGFYLFKNQITVYNIYYISLHTVGPKLEAPPTVHVPVGLDIWSLSAGASTSVI